jgi:hypothetical protein
MSTKPPTEQEIVQLARERLAEEEKRQEAARAARDAETKELQRYVDAFTDLLGGLVDIVRRLADQDVRIDFKGRS